MDDTSYNIAIIGGGIVGCALARELGKRFEKVLLMEKEDSVGFHTSGRNSGVVHSGFNPKPGTLKARLCVEGSRALRTFCREQHIPCEQVGTVVVATEEHQLPILDELKTRGEQNGVPGIEILDEKGLHEQEPNAKGLAALFSPTGAIVDSHALTKTLAHDAQELGVSLAVGQEVKQILERADAVRLSTKNGTYTAQLIVNCAGLYADRLAKMMGVGMDYVIAPFRGEYFVVRRPDAPLIRSMIYPVPNPIVPFLGVHLTRTVEGSVLIGPNAVPAFGREAYRRSDVNVRDLMDVICHKGFWNAFLCNSALISIAWKELRHSCSKRQFLKEANKLVNGLGRQELHISPRVGIRPQLIGSSGALVEDIVIEVTPRSVHLLNIVSPGMTSALSFAKWVSDLIGDDLTWKGSEALTTG